MYQFKRDHATSWWNLEDTIWIVTSSKTDWWSVYFYPLNWRKIKSKKRIPLWCLVVPRNLFLTNPSWAQKKCCLFRVNCEKVNSKEIMLCPIRRSGSILERLQNLGWHFYGQLNTRGRFSIMFRYVKLLSVYFSELWCHLVTCCFIQVIEDISITLLKRT